MKHSLLIVLCFAECFCSAADNDTLPGNRRVAVNTQFGFVIAHRPTVRHLQQRHTHAVELEYSIPTDGCSDWHQPFLLPSYSIAYQYIDLGNPEMLGAGHTLTARLDFPLNKHKKISSSISSGFGIGYIEKPYDRYENYKNVAIGSHLNAVVFFRYSAEMITGKYSRLSTGFAFTHFSNGSLRSPNLGINIPSLYIGYSRYLGKQLTCKRYTVEKAIRKPVNKIIASAGIKGLQSAYGLNMYGVTALSLSRHYIISHKSRLGGGFDLFYDRTLPWKLTTLYHEGLKEGTAFRSGIYAGYELTAGKITMLFQNGFYIYDIYDEDGFTYTKIGVQYAMSPKLVACFHLKSHFAKADYFEYGLGYIF